MRLIWLAFIFAAFSAAVQATEPSLPARYISFIRHEDFANANLLADAAIAKAKIASGIGHDAYCRALELKIRVNAFDPSVRAADSTLSDAIECREAQPRSTESSGHLLWLKIRQDSFCQYDVTSKCEAKQFAANAALLLQYRQTLGSVDFGLAAHLLGMLAYTANDLSGAYTWTHLGSEATRGPETANRLLRAKILVYECFRLGRLSRFPEAEAIGNEAVRLNTEMYGDPSGPVGGALFGLGQVEYFANDFSAARSTLERAIAGQRSLTHRYTNDALASSLDIWALLLRRTGEYDKARDALSESIALTSGEKLQEANLSTKLSNLGGVELDAGNCAAAIPPLQKAIALDRARSGDSSLRLVPKLNNLSLCELDRGQIREAKTTNALALKIATEGYGMTNAELSSELLYAAIISLAEREYPQAEEYLRRGLSLLPRDEKVLSDIRVQLERNLARTLHGLNRDEEAFDHAVKAETVRQTELRSFAGVLDESGALGFHANLRGGIDQILWLASHSNKPLWIQKAWELQVGSRLLVTRMFRERLKVARNSPEPRVAKLWREWESANDDYAKAIGLAKSGKTTIDVTTSAHEDLDKAERALAASMPGFEFANPIDLKGIRTALAANTSLVGYALSRVDPWSTELIANRNDPEEIYAFYLDENNATARLVDLGPTEVINAAVREWNVALRNSDISIDIVNALGKRVRELILDPFQPRLGPHRLMIVPAGDLHRVAWLAIPVGSGFVVDSGVVPQILESEDDLAVPRRGAELNDLLLVGATSSSGFDTGCGPVLPNLPGARRELDDLKTLWISDPSHGEVVSLVGTASIKATVISAMQRTQTIHFATHAVSYESDCPDRTNTSRSMHIVRDVNVQTSGGPAELVLAANPGKGQSGVSVLTATDIVGLRLDNVQLVTLAACDSGLGPVINDEGVFGLARAFHVAGAREVAMSLWSVNDTATTDLMIRMYREHWKNHKSVSESLTAAARDLLEARRHSGESIHPYYWAAFVVSGS